MFVYITCRLTELYKRSKNGKLYKRKEKHPVPCPICGKSTKWVSRHLKQVHNKGKMEASVLLNNVDSYRRRKGNSNPRPKFACPWPGCVRYVVCVADHVRRVHKASIRTLGDVERKVLSVSKGVTDTVSQSLPSSQIVTFHTDALVQTQVPLITCETAASTVDSHELPVESSPNEEVLVSPGVPPQFPEIFDSFKEYMSSVDAGRKARPEMYVLGARQVMEAVGMDFTCLTRSNVRKKFYEPLEAKIRTKEGCKFSIKTLRNKLRFLEYFCNYLLSDICAGWVIETWVGEIRKLKGDLPGWRQSLRGPCTSEEIHRRVLDGQQPVTLHDIHKYRQSQYAIVSTQILQNRRQEVASAPSVADFLRCRNHLLVLLSISNAHRSGVLSNFTISDYEQGLRAPCKADGRCFKILEHKTATTHGTANIAVDDEEAGLLASYISMRSMLDIQHMAPYVFINSSGTQMSASNIGSALTTAFASSGFNERVTCSKLRKTAVTEIHTNYPNKKGDIAAHMCHREATAAKFYKLIATEKNSMDSANLLRQALRIDETTEKMSEQEPIITFHLATASATTDDLTERKDKTKNDTADEYDSSDSSNDQEYKPDDSSDSSNDDDNDATDDFLPEKYTACTRGTWSGDNSSLVKLHFADLIDMHCAPMSEIKLTLVVFMFSHFIKVIHIFFAYRLYGWTIWSIFRACLS